MGSNQRSVPLQRNLIILNADAAPLVEVRDVGVVFVFVGVDNALGGEGGRTTMRVVTTTMFCRPNRCCATVMERSASMARPPATMMGNMVVDEATRLPDAS